MWLLAVLAALVATGDAVTPEHRYNNLSSGPAPSPAWPSEPPSPLRGSNKAAEDPQHATDG